MSFPVRCFAAIFLVFIVSSSSFAQGDALAQQKREKVLELLREKIRTGDIQVDEKETAAKTTATTDLKITSPSSSREAEISMAYNPNDSNKIVISFMSSGTSLGLRFPIYYSSNGGVSWTQSSFNANAILSADYPGANVLGGGDPAFAWDRTGRLYYAWIYLSGTTSISDSATFTLNWAYSDDDGHNWSIKPNHFIGWGNLTFAGDVLPYGDGLTDREWLAVDNTTGPYAGNVYCSFVCFPADGGSNFQGIKVLKPGIDTFGTAVPAYFGFSQFGNVEVDKKGRLHMSFAVTDIGEVRHALSVDGGSTFAGTPSLVASVGATNPSTPVLHNRENCAVNMAVDGPTGSGDNVHVVWSDYSVGVQSFYAHSTDSGSSWSTPFDLNTHVGKSTDMPVVAAYGNNVNVSYTAVESLAGANYYLVSSFNNGDTFSVPRKLSSVLTDYIGIGAASSSSSLFFGDYTRTQRVKCWVYATWADGRSGVPNVYFARTNSCASPPVNVPEISRVNSDIQLISVYPNPANGALFLDIKSQKSATFVLQLLDMTGKIVLHQQVKIVAGAQQVQVDTHNAAPGEYVLKLSDNANVFATRSVLISK